MDENKRKNEDIEPALRFDAFMGGVKAGGLRSVSSISLLVSYIVANLGGSVTAEIIEQATAEGELANHFEISDAISKLKKSGIIIENEDGSLEISKSTTADIELIEKDLPYTVRVNAMRLCQKIIAKETYRRENETQIIENGDAFNVVLTIKGDKNDFMKLTLFAPTRDQAEMIKEKFISNPVKVYETLIGAIFSNEE